jgi:uroporphyrinogen-III synthase
MPVTLGSLSGFAVGVTADRRWEEQAELLERRGARVVHGACIRTLPLGAEGGLRDATQAAVQRPPDVVVLTTGIGTRGWFAAAESMGLGEQLLAALTPATLLTRGPKAAGAALTAGLDVAWKAPGATNAELLDHLAELARSGGSRRVVVQLDGNPTAAFAESVRAQGHDVVAVPVYRWELPDDLAPARRLVEQCCDGTLDAVTFTAAHTVSNLFAIADRVGLGEPLRAAFVQREVTAVCVGPVCAGQAVDEGIPAERLVVPDHARLGAMVRAASTAFEARRRELRFADRTVVVQGRVVRVDGGDPATLTERERGVLDQLARRPGVVVPKGTLLREVWGDSELDAHVVEVTVNRLRRRLGAAGEGIETVVRRGYRLAVE